MSAGGSVVARIQAHPRLSLALLAFAVHAFWLRGAFVSDDFGIILDVVDGGKPSLARAVDGFVRPLPGVDAPLPADVLARFWRPMWRFSLYLDLRIWGPAPFGFYLTNILIHVGCVALLFGVVRRLGAGDGVAWTSAALFAVHPTHHEAVAWIAARCGPLALLLSLAAAELLLSSIQRGQEIDWRRASAAGVALVAGLLAKENALVFPGVAFALLMAAPSSIPRSRRLLAFAPVAVAYGLCLAARFHMLGEVTGGYAGLSVSPLEAEIQRGWGMTMWTLLGPAKANVVGKAAQQGLAALTLVALMGGLAGALATRRDLRGVVGVGAVWLVLALAPTWEFHVPADDHESVRYLYEPAAAMALLLAVAGAGFLGLVRDDTRRRRASAIAALGAVALFTTLHYANAGARHRAWAVARILLPQVHERLPPADGAISVFVDVPDHVEQACLGRNLLPYAVQPPFGDRPVDVKLFTDTPWERRRFQQLPQHLRQRPNTRFYVWDPAAFVFRETRPR